jgi:hypothetical protein
VFAVTSPFLITQHFSSMRTQEKSTSFHDFVKFHGKEQLVLSLRSVHDLAIYGSGKRLSRTKKDQLHDIKLLAEQINELQV